MKEFDNSINLKAFFDEPENHAVDDIYMLSKEDRKVLYDNAKAAYYAGRPIMSDWEFDRLEELLGLDNRSIIGAAEENVRAYGTTKSYTVKHPWKMGSLSKVQVREDKKTAQIDWKSIIDAIRKYTEGHGTYFRVEPKYDGCSFEAVYEYGILKSLSTRGDGDWGQNIMDWNNPNHLLHYHLPAKTSNEIICNCPLFTVRGEVLIKVATFKNKYIEINANPRSFVSSCIGSDYTTDKAELRDDLYFLAYDFRDAENEIIYSEDKFIDDFKRIETNILLTNTDIYDVDKFKKLYSEYEYFRNHMTDFQLDGFIIKPHTANMGFNTDKERPDDCVAIKFLPEVVETTVKGIEWNLGKNAEYTPVAILEDVELMGTVVCRASLYNYEFLVSNNVYPGAKVKLCKSGDIIPQIIEVTVPAQTNSLELPEHSYIQESYSNKNKPVRHLMKTLSKTEKMKLDFMASVKSLNIEGIGPAIGEQLFENSDCSNILSLIFTRGEDWIKNRLGYKLMANKVIVALKEKIRKITLSDIIQSMNIPLCGERVSEQCAMYFMGGEPNFISMPEKAYNWIYNNESDENNRLRTIINQIDYKIPKYKKDERIPIIMTGEPTAFGYKTKNDFLQKHPEFRNTTSWKEVKIVFTDDLNSNTGKMRKAKKNGVIIKTYEEA